MLMKYFAGTIIGLASLVAQVSIKVDFRRDVQPIFKANCYGCHGPSQQMNGFRLDRRSDAMKGGTLAMIGKGNSAGSRLYLRLIGNQFGLQMPPTGALNPQQIKIIKDWIDQGAEWPDDASGDAPPPPPDTNAERLMEALRIGDRTGFQNAIKEDPNAANRKGLGGSTPLMYATLYGDAATMRLLLENGADPNFRNDLGATALTWAGGDLEKTKLLVEYGADVNVRSDAGRTPLLIAAGRFGAGQTVRYLLEHGAKPNIQAPGLFAPLSPLSEAAGDESVMRMLIDHGADTKAAGWFPLFVSMQANCAKCVDLLLPTANAEIKNTAMVFLAPPLGTATDIRLLLDHGADANAKDPSGNTILMLAAASDALPVESVKALIVHGADVHARNGEGLTALDFARKRGNTPVVDALVQAGAKASGARVENAAKSPQPAATVRAALQRSVPLLQRNDAIFVQKSGCVSCHNNALTAMSIGAAHKNGLTVDDRAAREQVNKIGIYLDSWRERVIEGEGIPGDSDTISYILLGMAAQNYPADAATDAMAIYLKSRQIPNGQWAILAHRPPLESSNIEVTAASMHAMQLYAPKPLKAEFDKSIQLAMVWLAKAEPKTNEDRAFRLLGLGWAGGNKELIRKAGSELAAQQRPDGGWAQIPTLTSDAYATGQALVALRDSGAIAVTDAAYQRGVQFLMKTQYEDGSWHVKSRAIPIQPYFESGFPYGHDQWISASATNWATLALAPLTR